ncbi:uncharacterized protein LOC128558141 [Mercenaria mercenaria]|uniref:uncharacterized protein LOC128558141 n=1 Tax=Mercenaria mercenaria TaxID=6596 RepID=UPI00234F7EC6|nr:uncharacterized protein LOC128558141 [Mercenaria mercenaria]
MLGYRSPRALICCKSCTDHHKAWMILNIFLQGTVDEILTTYIKYCTNERQTPSVTGLYQYISISKDKNFRFLCDATFNIVLAVFVFRSGVRRNNSKFIMAGKSKFIKLFYGFNHTYYQEIVYRDLKTRTLAPQEVKEFLEKTESFSVSGHESKGEGGDFVLEAVNGKSKRWLPPGIPQHQHWLQVCRNLDLLDKIRENTFKETGMNEESKGVYQRDIEKEILEWRVKLRASGYISNTADENSCHISVSGENLDKTLVSFERQCNTNINDYYNELIKGGLPGKGVSLTPVFTTPLDRTKFHDIKKKKKITDK